MSQRPPPEQVFTARLRELIPDGEAGIVSKRSGVSREMLSRWRSRGLRPNPKLSTLARLAAVLRVPVASLISDDPPTMGHFEREGEQFSTLPVLVEVAAGQPRFAPSDKEDQLRLAFRTKWLQQLVGPTISERTAFLARVAGDSMVPAIRSGDIILVQRWWPPAQKNERRPPIDNGRIYLVNERDGDGQTVKRLALAERSLTVYADNPAFPPYSVDLEDVRLQDVVLGAVRWIGHKEE